MRLARPALAATLTLAALAAPAAADSITTVGPAKPATYDIGFRVGGYGFKREGDTSAKSWTECRMNGVGMFATRSLPGPFFVEVGLDIYTSQSFPLAPGSENDLPIDRMSGLFSTAGGVRTNLTSWLRGYLQIGGGLEVSRVSVAYAAKGTTIRDTKTMPEAFFGVGADIKIARGTYLGAAFRTLVMGNFDYSRQDLEMTNDWVSAPSAATVFDASPDLAAQGQFYLRREL